MSGVGEVALAPAHGIIWWGSTWNFRLSCRLAPCIDAFHNGFTVKGIPPETLPGDTNMTTTNYLATDRSHPYVAIYGVGASEAEALADARRGANDDEAEFALLPCTEALVQAVLERGGGPGDVSWTVAAGVASLR